MHRLVIAATVAALALTSNPPAHAAGPTFVEFETVDAVETNNGYFAVTGILVGASAPTRVAFAPITTLDVAGRCERFALLAMSKPGKYLFSASVYQSGYPTNCKLALRTP
ncbi:MAG: hypothetical protein K8W52_38110 [Deltaproteobacteria bacterium]|nr:hypothetical protein [Deltaproteobacteria bacterium]